MLPHSVACPSHYDRWPRVPCDCLPVLRNKMNKRLRNWEKTMEKTRKLQNKSKTLQLVRIHHDPSSTEVSRLIKFETSKELSASFHKKRMDMMETYGMENSFSVLSAHQHVFQQPAHMSHSTELRDFLSKLTRPEWGMSPASHARNPTAIGLLIRLCCHGNLQKPLDRSESDANNGRLCPQTVAILRLDYILCWGQGRALASKVWIGLNWGWLVMARPCLWRRWCCWCWLWNAKRQHLTIQNKHS